MANQTNYKRTVAGSVGAGMGAIFNGAGRTYYILEHKTNSQYHYAGESQKIIIDQIELGRDSSCQVRFDESFDTVSRKHAAIVRDGQNWQLIHLSTSNPTLVNGRPIEGSYYLQSGDEIQLSVGGPRMGFIVPQGKQALTSSIKLTERMNLFRQQALAPYRRAIWTLATLLLLTIVGFGILTYKMHIENEKLKEAFIETTIKSNNIQNKVDSINALIDELEKNPSKSNTVVKYVGGGGSNNAKIDELRKQLEELQNEKNKIDDERNNLEKELIDNGFDDRDIKSLIVPPEPVPPIPPVPNDLVTDIEYYSPHIYRLKVDRITMSDGVEKKPVNLDVNDCGTGFVLQNGTFVTARQNIQPWMYIDGNTPSDNWRRRLALIVALGYNVEISYDAYSTSGTHHKLSFTNYEFNVPRDGDLVQAKINVDDADWKYIENLGLAISKSDLKQKAYDFKVSAPSSRAFALHETNSGEGIPPHNGYSNNLPGNSDIAICGSTSNDPRHPQFEFKNATTSKKVNGDPIISLHGAPGNWGFLGGPAFMKDSNGGYHLIGVFVGNGKVVPISKCKL